MKVHQGQSLIEILVATGIIALVLVGVSDLITRSLSLISFQKDKNVALNIAQNQLYHYRQMRDLYPVDFFLDPQNNFSTCVGSFDDKYECAISYSSIVDGVLMSVGVSWVKGENPLEVQLSQVLAVPNK